MKKTIRDYELNGKKVIIRCDFNVPIKDGVIVDDNRIIESLKTIKYAKDNGAKVILLSHLGRVKEESDLVKNDLSLVAKRLSELLEDEVIFIAVTRGLELENAVNELEPGQVLLIQNTRYEDLDGKKESSNDQELGAYWASLGDIFINDAFGTAHRAHASNVGIGSNLPNGIGFLIEKELLALEVLNDPTRPFYVIMGGSKVSDKISVIDNLITKADKLIIGGGMLFTFLKAQGYEVGKSIVDEESLDYCKKLLTDFGDKIILPIDVNVTDEYSEDSMNRICGINEIGLQEMGLDIGPDTIDMLKKELNNVKTVIWNGPLGVYEMSKYALGTKKVLEIVSSLNAHTVLGGGDIVAAASKFGYKDNVSHASTGGGATLEYLEGKELPGLKVIEEVC